MYKSIPKVFLKIGTYYHLILLATIASVTFLPCLGKVHLFDWDEINFAEVAREMLLTGNYSQVQVNFEPFYEKPPLFFWLQVLSMKIWGINEWAARFPNALWGILTLCTLYLIGKQHRGTRFGLLWSLMHFGALLPHFYFKTGIIDPVFNYFIFLGIYSMVRLLSSVHPHDKYWAIGGGMALGLAILTKGPVGFLVPCLTCMLYWVISKKKCVISWSAISFFMLATLVFPLFWVGYETYQNGLGFIKNFAQYQFLLFSQPIAGHGQPFYYHWVVVFLGCFPASVLAIGNLFNKSSLVETCTMVAIMRMLFWVVMILFSLASTKIVHYSSMAYFPISFLAAHYLYSMDQHLLVPSRRMHVLLVTVGLLMAILFIALPIIGICKHWLCRFITDEFTLANIALPVPWHMEDCIVGISYLFLNLIAYYSFYRRHVFCFVSWAAIATTLCLNLGAILIVPKIEAHTQKPAIDFYKSLAGQPVYVNTVGFKSYAHLFYFQQKAEASTKSKDLNWLLTGELDKPAYFVLKINEMTQMGLYADIKFIKKEGGFAFFVRNKN